MPNYCNGYLRVTGYKDNVDEFRKILNADYNYEENRFTTNRHFFRVFECYDIDEDQYGLIKTAIFDIQCAWSIYSCMMDGYLTYYNSMINDPLYKDMFKGTTLPIEAKRLNLFIEVFSFEPGMAFGEHYIFDNFGNMLVESEFEYHETDLCENYDTVEEFNKENGVNISKELFEQYKAEGRWVEINGPDEMLCWENPGDHFVKTVMCKQVCKNK